MKTIQKYLRDRYGTELNMSKEEAEFFGIPYPLQKGWMKIHLTREIPNDMLRQLKDVPHLPMPSNVKKKKRRRTRDGVRYVGPPPGQSVLFLQSYEWRKLRLIVLKKRGRVCECCGNGPKQGVALNVDHIKPRKYYPELALVEDNLQVLCEDCNHGKGNWDMTDFRAESAAS